jgi:hypothetical protein
MKKFLAMLLLVLSFSLASCKKSNEVVALVDNPDTKMAAELGLDKVTVSLNTALDTTSGNYIDVKVSSELATSLVVRTVNFDEILEQYYDKLHQTNVNALTFASNISAEYKSAIEGELNNDTYGITAEKLGLNVELISKLSFSSKISLEKAKGLYDMEEDNIYCSVIYLPIKAIMSKEGQNVLSIHALIPVYAEFVIYENDNHSVEVFNNYKAFNYNVNNENVFVVEGNQ